MQWRTISSSSRPYYLDRDPTVFHLVFRAQVLNGNHSADILFFICLFNAIIDHVVCKRGLNSGNLRAKLDVWPSPRHLINCGQHHTPSQAWDGVTALWLFIRHDPPFFYIPINLKQFIVHSHYIACFLAVSLQRSLAETPLISNGYLQVQHIARSDKKNN